MIRIPILLEIQQAKNSDAEKEAFKKSHSD